MTSSWQTTSLAAVSDKPQYGAIASGSEAPVGPLFVRQTDIRSGRIDWSSVPYCDLSSGDIAKYTLKRGDVLVSRLGNGVGNAATVSEDREDAVFAGYLVRFRPNPTVADPAFVGYQLQSRAWKSHVSSFRSGAAQPTLNAQQMGDFEFLLPSLGEQRAIAAMLGALDEKIESNRRARRILRSLGQAKFQQVADRKPLTRPLETLTVSIARGVTPKYADELPSAPLVINQKCIRDGWVSLEPARRMHARDVAPAKRAAGGDILVNSTGTGTLGRVARWHEGEIFVDSHVSVVKPNPSRVEPIILAYALFGRQADIEDLATGSTGQTELSPARLGSLPVVIPGVELSGLSSELLSIEEKAEQLASETMRFEALRDVLLPELLSGRMGVPMKEAGQCR